MSFEEDRMKRNKRIQTKQNAIKKQSKIAKSNGLDVKQSHRFIKHHAMDCGNCYSINVVNNITWFIFKFFTFNYFITYF